MKNKKGFTLIELLAVIVILGILMLIAIPSVTKYIDSSKKSTYVNTITSLVDAVRYGIISGDSNYSMNGKPEKAFLLSQIELEKGTTNTPYGKLIDENSFVLVTKTANSYKYQVQVKDDAGYYIELIDIDDLNTSNIKKISDTSTPTLDKAPLYDAYKIGDIIAFAGSNWYVIKDSSKSDDYVTLMKQKVLTSEELGGSTKMAYYQSDTCYYNSDEDKVSSGCKNKYEISTVKTFLEGRYINTLGSYNLKSIDGYKIRLIQLQELIDNFGYTQDTDYPSQYSYNATTTPAWIYQLNGLNSGYWTMSSSPTWTAGNYRVTNSKLYANSVYNSYAIRPVINLLKTSI